MFRMVLISTALALAVPQVSGCRATALKPSPADSLREQVQSLEIEVDRLSLRNHELEVAVEKASSEASNRVIDAEAVAAQPHLVRIGIGSASGVRIGPSDVVDRMLPGSLTVYVEPVDGRGRFLQVTGRVSIQASMPVEGGEPILLGERSFSPIEVRDAWRSGFMGTHYTFEVPIEIPRTALEAVADPQASVLVVLRDAIDGGEFSRLVTVPIDDSASEPEDSRR
jgi:outer membrane murein-binding lipoprotein Lpp